MDSNIEEIIIQRMENQGIISKYQLGFKKKISTSIQILTTIRTVKGS
jgi:hypothetical protein